MANRDWIPKVPNLAAHAQELIQTLIHKAGESARAAVKQMYHGDRVLRVFVTTGELPVRFIE